MKKKFLYVILAFVSVLMLVACGETPEHAASIKINNGAEMTVGDKVALNVTLENVSMENVVVTSSNESVVKYENNELVAVGKGTATITVSYESVKAELAITVNEPASSPVSFELNGGTAEGLPTERGTETITLPTPVKDGASFEGWYANADFSGEKITELNANNMIFNKFYAKWGEKSYKVVYNFTDASGKTTKEEVVVLFKNEYTVVSKNVGSNQVFSGWYKEEALENEVTKIEASSYEEEVLNLYGKAIDVNTKFEVTFDYDGGSTRYATREDMVADFLADYNYVNKTKYSAIKQIGTTSSGPLTFDAFYRAINEDGEKLSEKWGWLYSYVYERSVAKLESGSYVRSGLKALIITNKSTLSNDEKKGVSIGVRAFVMGMKIGTGTLQSVDFSNYNELNGFWEALSTVEKAKASVSAVNAKLPAPDKENYTFLGWYKDAEGTKGPVKNIFGDCMLYAKYDENVKVTEVALGAKTATLMKFNTRQLEWTVSPAEATVRNVVFTSSNPAVATISEDGLITAVSTGKTMIRIASASTSGKYDEYELQVYTPDYIAASYDTVSYVTVGETIKLNAKAEGLTGDTKKLVWTSGDPTIATVDNGVVTGVKDGFVKIKVAVEGEASQSFEYGVTVLDKNASDIKKFIASANQGNVFFRYNLGIGAGTPSYYMDIIGSVSKLLYNTPYDINRSYETRALNMPCHDGAQSSTEFITVHYTGNMNANTGATMHANYFVSSGVQVSIHYITGNEGIYHMLDDKLIAWHAGDGTDTTFTWSKTGVKVKEGDPQYPVFGISANSKYTINGEETKINVPTGDTPETAKVTGNTFVYNGVEQNCINDMGLSFRIVDGEYEMGTTYWAYKQIEAGRICNHGGNNNSIGIESAVDKGSDLWYTWQTTARLCAHLMQENNLDITRVVGHHFFSAKDCPQPLLENDLEIWYEFKKLVEYEYELLTKYSNYELTFAVNEGVTNVKETGRVSKQLGNTPQSMNYTVTIKNKTTNVTETITLGAIIEGSYDK